MQFLRCFLWALVVQLVVRPGHARQANLRQMHVVTIGEANVDTSDALPAHETNGVLLLPESDNQWHAFNVHTLMLPQHTSSVSEKVSQNSWLQGKVGAAVFHLAKKSAGSTMLLLGIFICLGCVLLNSLNSGEQSSQTEKEPDDKGSWGLAYSEARGARREAMELLFNTGIIAREDLSLHNVHGAHIEECVQVAAHMLKEQSMEEWVTHYKHAQRTFEEQISLLEHTPVKPSFDIMAEFEDCDGSWARAYLQSCGQRERQEAFELLLHLSIVSKAEFADSLVSPPYIEERVSVALSLLKRQSLSKWVALCETAEGSKAKASLLAQFSAQGGHSDSPIAPTSPYSIDPDSHRSSQDSVRTMPVERHLARGATLGLISDTITNADGSSFDRPYETGTFSSPVSKRSARSDTEPAVASPPRTPKSPIFVLPRSGNIQDSSRSLPPTAVPGSGRLSDSERPRSLNWPSGGSGGSGTPSSRPRTPPTSGNASGFPAQIKFADNAVSGSSWQKAVTPPGSMRCVTPPGSVKDLTPK